MDLLSFCPRVLWSYSSPPALVSGHGGATFFVPGLTTALFRMRILPPGPALGPSQQTRNQPTENHTQDLPTPTTAAVFGSRSGQVVGVVSHLIELALVEIVVPDIAVRDLELASG